MLRRPLLLSALLVVILVLPTWTAPVPVKKPVKEIINSIGMKLVRIDPGKFMMGSPTSEKDRGDGEHLHEVEITKAFYVGVYAVTQKDFKTVMGSNPSCFSAEGRGKDGVKGLETSKFPVDSVNWHDAINFCEKLTEKEKGTGRVYRLPTEAEWEYACRAGAKTRYHSGGKEEDLQKAGWYRENSNSDSRTHAVGSKKANAWGLYDMHGNVWQWCSDWYDHDYCKQMNKEDPKGPKDGVRRILRGGSWGSSAKNCRAADRYCNDPRNRLDCIGFRVVCVPSGK